jgi:hypothetical protein
MRWVASTEDNCKGEEEKNFLFDALVNCNVVKLVWMVGMPRCGVTAALQRRKMVGLRENLVRCLH